MKQTNKRNTRKEKKKNNKRFPYRKGGKKRERKIPQKITKQTINKNLKRVEEGKALTIPLSVLGKAFKGRYFVCTNCGESISPFSKYGLCSECLVKLNNQNPEYCKGRKQYMKRYYKEHKQSEVEKLK